MYQGQISGLPAMLYRGARGNGSPELKIAQAKTTRGSDLANEIGTHDPN